MAIAVGIVYQHPMEVLPLPLPLPLPRAVPVPLPVPLPVPVLLGVLQLQRRVILRVVICPLGMEQLVALAGVAPVGVVPVGIALVVYGCW